MSSEVRKLLSFTKPVCNVVKNYSGVFTTILFCIIVFAMTPLDLITQSSIQRDIMVKVRSLLSTKLGHVFVFILFICFYVNNDIENMLLLLYVLWLITQMD
jgi:hypothetical protein